MFISRLFTVCTHFVVWLTNFDIFLVKFGTMNFKFFLDIISLHRHGLTNEINLVYGEVL